MWGPTANKDKLLIMGAGGHGRAAAYLAASMKRWSRIAFLNDVQVQDRMEFEIIGRFIDAPYYTEEYDFFVALGDNELRENMQLKLEQMNASLATLIHPSAWIGENVKLGIGTIIMAGAVIICNSTIGKGAIINTSASIDHDNVIGDFVHISPGVHLAGEVTVGKNAWICIGATVINHLTVAEHCIVGAGAVVIDNITEKGTYVGVPASKLKR